MIDQFFKAISYLFHPLVMPMLGMYFLFESPTKPVSLYKLDALYYFPDLAKNRVYLVIAVLTFAAPLLSLLIMYWNKMISGFHLEKKEERAYPFFIVSFYYLLAYIFVAYQWPPELQHPAFVGFLFGMLLVFIITFVLNFWTKISVHAVAVFGILGLLVAYNQTQLSAFESQSIPNLKLILFFAIVAGLVVTARLYLKAHSLKEVLQGMVIGFDGIYVCVKYGIYV